MTNQQESIVNEDADAEPESKPTPGEFAQYCNKYYRLTTLLATHQQHLQTLLDNAPAYHGQTNISEIDAIIGYYREVQAVKKTTDQTQRDLNNTGHTILLIMQHFEIPTGTVLTGEIPGELEYNIWADGDEVVHIRKTRDLAPEVEDANIIVIRFSGAVEDEEE